MEQLRYYWNQKPLSLILVVAFLVRVISILFSKGYGMHDDHFLVIEAAQSWVSGNDYNDWLPQNRKDATPTGHSWFYVGLHYYFFKLLESIGIYGPQAKMYIVRLLHALWYLLAIRLSYKITLKLDTESSAKMVGLFMALLWFTPIMSVRNLVEAVCLVPLLGASYYLVKEENLNYKNIILAGLLMGVSVSIRFQTILFLGGVGLVLLSKNVVKAAVFGVFFGVSLFVTQIGDLFLWGRPFAEFSEYIAYNFAHKTTYFQRPWYMYFGTLAGLVLPPFSLFLLVGWSKVFTKNNLILLIPSLIFFGFHCYFPNKQERFIIPFIPFFILFGWIGWSKILTNASEKLKRFHVGGMRFFWVLNTILLLLISPAYSKKSRVEAMEFLGDQADYNGIFVERSFEYGVPLLPKYYSGRFDVLSQVNLEKSPKLNERIELYCNLDKKYFRQYIVFLDSKDLNNRIEFFKQHCECELIQKAVIEPSYLDKLVHWLNPINDNETAFIYRINRSK